MLLADSVLAADGTEHKRRATSRASTSVLRLPGQHAFNVTCWRAW